MSGLTRPGYRGVRIVIDSGRLKDIVGPATQMSIHESADFAQQSWVFFRQRRDGQDYGGRGFFRASFSSRR